MFWPEDNDCPSISQSLKIGPHRLNDGGGEDDGSMSWKLDDIFADFVEKKSGIIMQIHF